MTNEDRAFLQHMRSKATKLMDMTTEMTWADQNCTRDLFGIRECLKSVEDEISSLQHTVSCIKEELENLFEFFDRWEKEVRNSTEGAE